MKTRTVLLIVSILAASCSTAPATSATTSTPGEAPTVVATTTTLTAATTTTVATTTSTAASTTTTTEVEVVATGFPIPTEGVVDRWVPQILATYPHDPAAFTQGLLLHEGVFYESTGLYGASSVRRVEPMTGDVLAVVPLGDDFFGEGLAEVDGVLVQLTWREGVAFTWDAATLEPGPTFGYGGEGWGLCDTGTELMMTDGSAILEARDRTSFDPLGEVLVTLEGEPVTQLNEIECVAGLVFANVWQTTDIVVIDPATGVVTAVIDASGLDSPGDSASVLNGIAYDATTGVFYLTGKLWPSLYEVVFVAE